MRYPIIVALLLTTACSTKQSTQDLQDRVDELESQNTQLQQQLDEERAKQESEAPVADTGARADTDAQQPAEGVDEANHDDSSAEDDRGDAAAQAANRAAQAARDAAAADSGVPAQDAPR